MEAIQGYLKYLISLPFENIDTINVQRMLIVCHEMHSDKQNLVLLQTTIE